MAQGKINKWNVELTDTFCGEANYSWVRRATFEIGEFATKRQIVFAGKKAIGLTGVKCETSDMGDEFWIRPRNSCTICFITFDDQPDN